MLIPEDDKTSPVWDPKCARTLWAPRIPSDSHILRFSHTVATRRLFSDQELHLILSCALEVGFKTAELVLDWLTDTLDMLHHVFGDQESFESSSKSDDNGLRWWGAAFAIAKVSQTKDTNFEAVKYAQSRFLL